LWSGGLGLSWNEVDGIMGRAVARGLARRKLEPPERIGVELLERDVPVGRFFEFRHSDV
jgi:hypothetical protein